MEQRSSSGVYRCMLEHSLLESKKQKTRRSPVTVLMSVFAHAITVGVLVLVPLLHTQALTIPSVDTSLLIPKIKPPNPIKVFAAHAEVQRHTQSDPSLLTAPESIPTRIVTVDDPAPTIGGLEFDPRLSNVAGLLPILANRAENPEPAPMPPPLPPPPPVVKSQPVRISNLEQANLIHRVNPSYPPLAKQTRVQGVVVLEAMISKEGGIESLRVVTGHPFLIGAALDAVKQWRYKPLLLNGEPIEVITTITVSFTLQ